YLGRRVHDDAGDTQTRRDAASVANPAAGGVSRLVVDPTGPRRARDERLARRTHGAQRRGRAAG
ncbi:MAG TPA: hypothetical protein DGU37_07100, partial [Microbacterium sp.]|nr:hypothetical protein [Microbacterium sp.]